MATSIPRAAATSALATLLALTAPGCGSGAIGDFGQDTGSTGGTGAVNTDDGLDPEPDSRLIADVVTWPCWDPTLETYFLGAYGMDATLEYAPDALQGLELPGPGECVRGVSMFPQDAGNMGADIDAGEDGPRWVLSSGLEGLMERRAPGFYYGDVLGSMHSCEPMDELLPSGLRVESAGEISGAATPEAGTLDEVVVSTDVEGGGLLFGEPLEVSWSAAGWDTSWVQIRMERDGFAYDNVTCNTTGASQFTVDEATWELLDEEMSVEVINLYVGFQNAGELQLESGLKVQVLTRAMYVGVIQD